MIGPGLTCSSSDWKIPEEAVERVGSRSWGSVFVASFEYLGNCSEGTFVR